MFMDLWVATDGITTVRFSDYQSAEIYCAQTGWQTSDLYKIRQQVTVSEGGAITVEPWCNRMDPDVDTEIKGSWSEDGTFLPPAVSVASGQSEDDIPVIYSSTFLAKLGRASEMLDWDFRDLAATETNKLSEVLAYVEKCIPAGKKPNRQEVEKIIGRYAD